MSKFKVGDLVYSNYLPNSVEDEETVCKVVHVHGGGVYIIEVPDGWPYRTCSEYRHIPSRQGYGGWHVSESNLTLARELTVAEKITNKFLEMQT